MKNAQNAYNVKKYVKYSVFLIIFNGLNKFLLKWNIVNEMLETKIPTLLVSL